MTGWKLFWVVLAASIAADLVMAFGGALWHVRG